MRVALNRPVPVGRECLVRTVTGSGTDADRDGAESATAHREAPPAVDMCMGLDGDLCEPGLSMGLALKMDQRLAEVEHRIEITMKGRDDEWRGGLEGIPQTRRANFIKYLDYANRGSQYGWKIGHILPVARVGTDRSDNFRPLHWRRPEWNRTRRAAMASDRRTVWLIDRRAHQPPVGARKRARSKLAQYLRAQDRRPHRDPLERRKDRERVPRWRYGR